MRKGKLGLLTSISEILSFMLLLFMITQYALLAGSKTVYIQKHSYTVTFWLGFLVYGLFAVIKRFPGLVTYPVAITPKNVAVQARMMRFMLSLSTLLSMCLVADIFVGLRLADMGIETKAPIFVAGVCFLGIIADVIIYFAMAKRRK